MKIGQSVNVVLKPELKCIGIMQAPYYSGLGILKAIKEWPGIGTMVAVYFQDKGTVWFRPDEIQEEIDET